MAPGTFDTTEKFHEEMIEDTIAQLPPEELQQSKGPIGLFSLTCAPLSKNESPLSSEEIVAHVIPLRKLGSGVLVFREIELYKMSTFVNRFTKNRIHFAVRLPLLLGSFEAAMHP